MHPPLIWILCCTATAIGAVVGLTVGVVKGTGSIIRCVTRRKPAEDKEKVERLTASEEKPKGK